mgnify:CR=1 FL=1
MDGCSMTRTFFSIIIPVSKPGLATAATLAFLNCWNDYLFASVIIASPGLKTLTMRVYDLKAVYSTEYGLLCAGVALAIVPVIIMYVLFQEQVIEIATAVAGFSPGESDRLRRAMTHFRSEKEMEAIGELFVAKATARGVEASVARSIFSCILGYAGYGFCEAHAAAFALTAYQTAYLACHRPAAWFAALLNHQPMGYYPPRTLVVEARRRGVRFLRPDVHRSGADYAVVAPDAVRVGLKAVRGLRAAAMEAILRARARGAFRSLADLCRRTGVRRDEAEALILAGALDDLAPPDPATGRPNRRALLWSLAALAGTGGIACGRGPARTREAAFPGVQLPLPDADLPDFSPWERALYEYQTLGFFLTAHPLALWRERLRAAGYVDSRQLGALPAGARVRVAGLAVRPHRPPTRSGRTVVFLSLEDEHGLIDVTVFEDLYQKCGALLFSGAIPPLAVEGRVARRGGAVSLTAEAVAPLLPPGQVPWQHPATS